MSEWTKVPRLERVELTLRRPDLLLRHLCAVISHPVAVLHFTEARGARQSGSSDPIRFVRSFTHARDTLHHLTEVYRWVDTPGSLYDTVQTLVARALRQCRRVYKKAAAAAAVRVNTHAPFASTPVAAFNRLSKEEERGGGVVHGRMDARRAAPRRAAPRACVCVCVSSRFFFPPPSMRGTS